jgi:hypothetical protein
LGPWVKVQTITFHSHFGANVAKILELEISNNSMFKGNLRKAHFRAMLSRHGSAAVAHNDWLCIAKTFFGFFGLATP